MFLAFDTGKQRNLDEHARDEEGGLEELSVNVHMERKLTLTLCLLLFGSEDLVSLVNALRQKLLHSLCREDVLQNLLRFLNQTDAECAKANLNDRAIVQYLSCDIGRVDRFLEMRHEEHVSCGMEVVVKGVMVDMAQHRTSAKKRIAGLVEVNAEGMNELFGGGLRECDRGFDIRRSNGRF